MSLAEVDATDGNASSNKLPLEWTRLRPSSTTTGSSSFCCNDLLTCQRHSTRTTPSPRLPLLAAVTDTTTTRTSKTTRMIHGYAVFCLHELDPSWFQGYFIPNHSRRPWGLLAVQEEVDDCLGCADGGFRRITLTIYPPPESQQPKEEKNKSNNVQQHQHQPQESFQLVTVDWTGGDMIQLRHEQLVMDADRLWTGMATLPHLQRYFEGLIAKLRIEFHANDESTPILDFLPDVAVIVGKMSLVPNHDDMDVDHDVLSE